MGLRLALAVAVTVLIAPAARSETPKSGRPDPRLLSEGPVVMVALSPDGSIIATGGSGRIIRLWDIASGKELRPLEHPRGISALAFSPNGKLLASAGGDRRLRLWDLASGKELRQIEVAEGEALTLAFSPDGKLLASGGEGIRVWEVASGKERYKLSTTEGTVFALAFAPDGQTLASGDEQRVRLWNAADGEARRDWEQRRGVLCLAFSPDGKVLASGAAHGRVYLWETASGKEVKRFGGQIGRPGCWSLAFAADGRTLVCGTSAATPALRRWDVATGKELTPLPGFRGALVPITFPPDSRALTGDAAPLDRIWNVADPVIPRTPPVVHLSAEEVQAFWDDLAGADGSRTAEAISTLTADAPQTLPFLKKHLQPEPPFPPVAQMIADLDDTRFAVRQKATQELQRMGKTAEQPLRQALKDKPSLEMTRRIQGLLERIEQGVMPPNQLRAQRAVQVLEQLNTTEAREVLTVLTKGAPEGWLTREATSALRRMKRE